MPHTRTDIELDDEILKQISGAQYKVLRYLCNRADPWGACYPGNQAIADGTLTNLRDVVRHVPALVDIGLVAYLRRGAFDEWTRRALVNVVMVNPAYICLAEPYLAEAQAKWDATGVSMKFHTTPESYLTNTNNQYQEPIPERKPVPRTNTNNQPPTAPLTTKGKGTPELDNDPTAARENDETQDATPNSVSTAKLTRPGVPPETFKNPMPITETLPDQQHEVLALRLRGLGIAMPLARGFILEYGLKNCEDALLQTLAADRTNDNGLRNLGGFFRFVLQKSLVDRYTFKAHESDQEAGY